MRTRKVRKRRKKPMTASEMRSGVTFQSGLTWKAKLALAAVILVGLALTVVVMMAVNGSFSMKGLGEDNPENQNFREPGMGLEAFENGGGASALPPAEGTGPETPNPSGAQQPAAPVAPTTGDSELLDAFEE